MYVYVPPCVRSTHRGQKRVGSPGTRIALDVSHPVGAEPRSSGIASNAYNHRGTALVLRQCFIKWACCKSFKTV